MKKLFAWRLTPSKAEFTELWQNATFVFDTNFLLDFYRRSRSTSEDFFKALEYLHSQDRIWLPYQVADEFFQNREEVIVKVTGSFEKALSEIKKWKSTQEESLKQIQNDIKKDKGKEKKFVADELESLFDNHANTLKEFEESFQEKIEYLKNNHFPLNTNEDDFLQKILSLFDGKVGKPYNQEELQGFYKEGEKRYQREQPPGFMDKDKKKDEEKYGDLILWKQILEFAKTESKPIIFVTGDKKEDWWSIKHGKTIGLRMELRHEFQEYAKQPFYMYRTENFLTLANKEFNLGIDPHSIEESNLIAEATDEQASDDEQALGEILMAFREIDTAAAQKALRESLSAIIADIADIKAHITPDFSQAIKMEVQKTNEALRAIEQQKLRDNDLNQ